MTHKYTKEDVKRCLEQLAARGMEPGEHGPDCPDVDLLERFAKDQISEKDREQILSHIIECVSCLQEVGFLLGEVERYKTAIPVVFFEGQQLSDVSLHWLDKPKRAEIDGITRPGKYVIEWDELRLGFTCTENDLKLTATPETLRRAAASDPNKAGRTIRSPGGMLQIRILPGLRIARFEIERFDWE
jgi:hypothetical protein